MNLKKIIQLFIPPIYYKVKRRLFPKPEPERHPMPKIERNGDKMIIIGNGPSLNKTMELYGDVVCETPCMMVNFAANTELYERIRPSVYLLVDPAWYNPSDEQKQSIYACIDAIVQKTSWQMKIIMPHCAMGCFAIERFKENPNLEIFYYEDGWQIPEGMTQYEAWDKNLVTPPGQTVLNTAVWLSIYWGYKETYLVGVDTSWLEDTHVNQEDNRVYTIDTHFYKNEDVYGENLWKENKRYISSKYHEEIETLVIALKSYWELREYADWKDVKVYNASEYSCIDAFERKKLK